MDNLISIILCCYNSGKFLYTAIESVLNQDHRNLELIFVNDGSTDNSLKIAESFAIRDNRIKIISQSNRGLNAARNVGSQNISDHSKALLFFDADDIMSKNMISKLFHELQSGNNVGAVFCNYLNIDENGKTITKDIKNRRIVSQGKWFKELPVEEKETPFFSIYSWTLMAEAFTLIRKDLFFRYGMWDEINFPKGDTYGESIPLFGMIALEHKVIYLNQELYKYRRHTGQITKETFNMKSIQQKIEKVVLFKCSDNPILKKEVQQIVNINKYRLPLYNYLKGSLKHEIRFKPLVAIKNLFFKSGLYLYSLLF